MAGRRRSIRAKIFAIILVPVTALLAVYAYGSVITVQSGLELLKIRSVYNDVVLPVQDVIDELQAERSLSAGFLGGGATTPYPELQKQRRETDAAVVRLEQMSLSAKDDTPDAMWSRLQELVTYARGLGAVRKQVDERVLTAAESVEHYSSIGEVGFQVYDRLMIAADLDIIQQVKAVILVSRAREVMSQQSALLTGALAANRMTKAEYDAFGKMAGKRKLLYELGVGQLDAELAAPFLTLNTSATYRAFSSMENEVTDQVAPGRALVPGALAWRTSSEAMTVALGELLGEASQTIADRTVPLAERALWRMGIAAGVGLLIVAFSVFFSIRVGRRLTAEMVGLEEAAIELADRRLPSVVTRLRRGEDVDVSAETPPVTIPGKTTEVDHVANAFTSVQRTAIEAAVDQARMREGVNKVFLNLARRNQSLLHRQLSMLDGLEQQVTDPDVLEKLFGIDHLTTRMRRHAEGLIILSGAAPGRGWRSPVALFDVVRAAVEQVEDYLRVDITVPHGPALLGPAVTDMIHLVAELVENATIFSPPHTQVFVNGEVAAKGFALEIEDRGLGIGAEEMAQLNARLSEPPEFDLADSERLGLFVVGRLARRHGVRVSLRSSPYGGTSAIVLIPASLMAEDATPERALALTLAPPPDDLPRRVRQANLASPLRPRREQPQEES
ncbi:sensor histidine kinase [Microtetraspora niveoalba]|uniref:sensor histidine kinase n=1 Tax=Microtetraspora niveoalba TaxID=46175 RepID=UPI00082A8495|nr:ATP-binding protein [Microtetraspora niveoalba]